MLVILCIIGLLIIIGVSMVALLPALAGALIPTALATCAGWIAYRFIKKGMRKIKDITK